MTTLQIYASELAKFSWLDDSETVLVAGSGITGIVGSDGVPSDPRELVGTAAEPTPVRKNSKWAFRADEPIVVSQNADGSERGRFAFLVPVK